MKSVSLLARFAIVEQGLLALLRITDLIYLLCWPILLVVTSHSHEDKIDNLYAILTSIVLVMLGIFTYYLKRVLKRAIASRIIKKIRSDVLLPKKIKIFIYLRSFSEDHKVRNPISTAFRNTFNSFMFVRWQRRLLHRFFLLQPPPTFIRYYVREYHWIVGSRRFWNLEKVLSDVLDSYGVLIAIGNQEFGDVARIPSTDETWQSDVAPLMRRADLIICNPGRTEGTAWELSKVFGENFEAKTIFVDPGHNRFGSNDGESEWDAEWAYLQRACKQYDFPDFEPLGEFFTIRRRLGRGSDDFVVEHRHSWGEIIQRDLLTLLDASRLLRLSAWDRWRAARHRAKRPVYIGVESDWYGDTAHRQYDARPERPGIAAHAMTWFRSLVNWLHAAVADHSRRRTDRPSVPGV